MMGVDPLRQRDMMHESLDVIVRLLRGETVMAQTDWYTLEHPDPDSPGADGIGDPSAELSIAI
jgi:hypothetical protein